MDASNAILLVLQLMEKQKERRKGGETHTELEYFLFKACCMVSRKTSKAHKGLIFIRFPLGIIDQSVL